MKPFYFFMLLFLSCFSYAQSPLKKIDLEEFKNRLVGNFDNQEQASLNKEFPSLSLHIREVALKGKKKDDGYWLYAEFSETAKSDEPFRQRIYHLHKKDNSTLVQEVYELPNANRYTGAWNEPEKLKKLPYDSLIARTGCAVFFQKDNDGNFIGKTEGNGCESKIGDAVYTTIEIACYTTLQTYWARGFNKDGKQVWGPEKGGYRFRKWTTPKRDEAE
ncbi:MAG: chromophore lyase CpcT/CpeT [Bacteroidetes bacterium]|nr:chromophore lyase CpcT/CpeT [Bacteroidota bacterium]MBS1739597.1 chromophore lyase CpcT/CpeT [Bacteroidota bacterium]